ncbi:MAG TPA: glycosyltransferase family 4 protein [Bacteroidota bacterium]|nr:glycosyltransferase family 4 protein [Bacteroidota bacterium]
METISKSDILNYLKKRKKFFLPYKFIINVDNINTIRFKDIIELYLSLSGNKKFFWKDSYGRIIKKRGVLQNIFSILFDFLLFIPFYLFVLSYLFIEEIKVNKTFYNNNYNKCIYLRTDHYFNIKGGGSISHISGVINGLKSLGVKTNTFSTDSIIGIEDNDLFYKIEPKYTLFRNIPDFSEILYNFQLLHNIKKINQTLSNSFIYQRYSLGNFTGIVLKNRYNIPYICEYNGSILWIEKNWGGKKILFKKILEKIEILNLKKADLVVTVSEALKDELFKKNIQLNKILVNPNGVDCNVYKPNIDSSNIKKQYALEGKKVIGFIGTFGKWHGAEFLTEAFAFFLKKYNYDNVVLFLIGDGLMMPVVKDIIKKYNMDTKVILTGLIEQKLGPQYLSACDILIIPHIPNPDGTRFFNSPIKLFEYMAMEKPIIASRLEQIGEILEHEKTALLFTPSNKDELINSIYRLLNDSDLAFFLAKNARKEVLKKYTWNKHVERILKKIEELNYFDN